MKAVVGERGQATIPKVLRDRLGIKAGTLLDFQEIGGKLIVAKVPSNDDLVGRVYGCLGTGLSTDTLLAELRAKT